jgi:hypothetical protein
MVLGMIIISSQGVIFYLSFPKKSVDNSTVLSGVSTFDCWVHPRNCILMGGHLGG